MSSGDYIDIGVLVIIVILGLRGLGNGLIHEAMGTLGVVLGFFCASHFCANGAEYLELAGLELDNKMILLTFAFLLILAVVWIGFLAFGATLNRFVNIAPEFMIINVYGGFIFAILKYAVIFCVLVYGLAQIDFLKKPLEDFTKETRSYPIMHEVGQFLVNIEKIQKAIQELKEKYESTGSKNSNQNQNKEQTIEEKQDKIKNTLKETEIKK